MSKHLILASFTMLLSAFGARADAVYTYVGDTYIDFTTPFGPGDFINGSFTIPNPLIANLVNYTFTPLSFSFSGFADGYPSISQTSQNVENFELWTDSQGAITHWEVDLASGLYSIDSSYRPGDSYFDVAALPGGSGETSFYSPGTWTGNVTPEPSTVALFTTGLLASYVAIRRQRSSRPTPVTPRNKTS